MINKILLTLVLVFVLSVPTVSFSETLDKNTALRAALEQNPAYKAKLSEIDSSQADIVEASLRPNPSLSFEIENFGGSDQREGFERTELTLGLSQKIELAGKRRFRTDIAQAGHKIAREEALGGALNLVSETEYTFYRTAIAKERLELANDRLELAEQTRGIVKRRVNAAASADVELTKADIEWAEAEIEKHHVEERYNIARNDLARLLGQKNGEELEVQADLSKLPELLDYQTVISALESTPQSRIREFERTKAKSSLDLAKAAAVPDPTVGFGVRQFTDNDDTAFVAELSFPLPVFDRNQGGVQRAQSGIKRSQENARATELSLHQAAIQAYESYGASLDVAHRYQNDILPNANKAFNQAEYGYNLGAFTFLDLLDAQRTLNKVRSEYLDNLLELYEAKSQIDFLMGTYKPLVLEVSKINKEGESNE